MSRSGGQDRAEVACGAKPQSLGGQDPMKQTSQGTACMEKPQGLSKKSQLRLDTENIAWEFPEVAYPMGGKDPKVQSPSF